MNNLEKKTEKLKILILAIIFFLGIPATLFGAENQTKCKFSYFLMPSPRQVSLPSDSISVEATVSQTEMDCLVANLKLYFLHGDDGKEFAGPLFVNKDMSFSSNDQWMEKRSVSVKPSDLGYASGSQVCFSLKIDGGAAGWAVPPGVKLVSAPSAVGVGVAPNQSKCKNLSPASIFDFDLSPGSSSLNFTGFDFSIDNPLAGKADNIIDLLGIIANFIFQLGIPVAVIIIIYSGILFLVSRDKPAIVQKATNGLKYAAIGLAVLLIGKGFVSLIQSILSIK